MTTLKRIPKAVTVLVRYVSDTGMWPKIEYPRIRAQLSFIMIIVLKFLIIAYIWCSWWRMFLTSWFSTFLFYYDLIWPRRGFQSIAWNKSTFENILKEYCIYLIPIWYTHESWPILWNCVLKFLSYNLTKIIRKKKRISVHVTECVR